MDDLFLPETLQDWLQLLTSKRLSTMSEAKRDQLLQYLTDEQIIYQLILRISDPESLEFILPYANDTQLIDGLRNRHNSEIRSLLAKYISDYPQRLQLYQQEVVPEVRVALLNPIIENIENLHSASDLDIQSMLPDLIQRENDPSLKARMITLLDSDSDQVLIQKIATGDEHVGPRRAAVAKLTNPLDIKEILEKERNGSIRLQATKLLRDIDILESLATSDIYWKVRLEALKSLNNEELLTTALLHDPVYEVRLYCLDHITDRDVIASLAMNEHKMELRKRAIELVIESGDQDTMMIVALEDPDPDLQSLVLPHIINQKILQKVALQATSSKIAELAIEQIIDAQILSSILFASTNLRIQRAVIKQLIQLNATQVLGILESQTTGSIKSMIMQHLQKASS